MGTAGRQGTALHFPDRMLRAFDDMASYPLVIVEAPMGYGKTTAVRTFLARQDRKAIWLRVFDANLSAFWHDFCACFTTIDEKAATRLAAHPPLDDAATGDVLRMLQALPLSGGLTLVVDDYHLVAGTQTDRCFSRLIQAQLPGLQVILVTRAIRMPEREELRLKGLLYTIDKQLLSFDAADVAAYCRHNGASLRKGEAESLHGWSEGWISALYLALLAHSANGRWETAASVDALMQSAVYAPLDARAQRLLRCMSLFERFTPEMAAHVCNEPQAGDILSDLVARNAFIRADPASGDLQVHRLFNGFLREQLDHDDATDAATLHNRAGSWFQTRHDALAAMRHFHAAGNFDDLLGVLAVNRGHVLRIEQKGLLLSVLAECPADVLDRHPVALLVAALCLTTFDEMEMAISLAGRVQTLLSEGAFSPDESARLDAELTLFQSFGCYNDIGAMGVFCREAAAICDLPVRFMDTSGSWTFDAPSVQYMFHREPGTLDEVTALLRDSLHHYNRLTGGHGAGADQLIAAEAAYLRGDAVEAEIGANRALFAAERAHQHDLVIAARFLQARLSMIAGRIADMAAHLDAMARTIADNRAWHLTGMQEMCQGYLYGCLCRLPEIPSWLAEGDGRFEDRLFQQARGFAQMVHARALLLRQAHLRLIGITDGMLASVQVFPSQAAVIHLHLCRAAACAKAFRQDQALADMTTALAAAAPDGLVMPFIENYDLACELLDMLHGRNVHHAFIDRIQAVAATVRPAMERCIREQSQREQAEKTRPRLSDREAQVAKMAAEGLSNRLIGQRLHITENTVKTLLKNVFEKLDIHARALLPQALARVSHPVGDGMADSQPVQ